MSWEFLWIMKESYYFLFSLFVSAVSSVSKPLAVDWKVQHLASCSKEDYWPKFCLQGVCMFSMCGMSGYSPKTYMFNCAL